ncbi:hypothetical protein [Cryobacterium sp. CG_9.6]|uniref:hypothetical protein n=1 Tax=Cryobacterium sp. CG_9.6 TaxID=2760710 RepID=UPI002473D523|nr:hypothetical protein [Cryobacterium sp. CG_9.6]MDH6236114.1 hypothetical protein [Cryobacterium sp. CG_9.6]
MAANRHEAGTTPMSAGCLPPPRRIASAFQPSRIVLAVLALGLFVVGALIRDLLGLALLGVGAVALLTAVVFPVIKQVEFGFPTGVKISAALSDRENELQLAFTQQRGDLGLYTQLMCDNSVLASRLLEAAWARTAMVWRGPITPALRGFVLCEFVRLLTTQSRWNRATVTDTDAMARPSALLELTVPERIIVVLKEFADLPLAQISAITGRPLTEIENEYRLAESRLGQPHESGTGS